MNEPPKADPLAILKSEISGLYKRIEILEQIQPEKFTIAMSERAYIETMKTIQMARGNDMETLIVGVTDCIKQFLEQQTIASAREPAPAPVLGEKRDRVKETEQVIEMLKKAGQDPKDHGTLLSSIWRGF